MLLAGRFAGPWGAVASVALPMLPAIGRGLKRIGQRIQERRARRQTSPSPVSQRGPALLPQGTRRTFDERSEKNLATLHPKAAEAARVHLGLCQDALADDGVTVKIISGTRSFEEQDALYAKGRTAPGKIVTNAKAGFSNHNFGIAWDLGLFKGSDYLEESPFYQECGIIGERLGLEWGGRWERFPDQPHFQLRTGMSLAEMREAVNQGKDFLA